MNETRYIKRISIIFIGVCNQNTKSEAIESRYNTGNGQKQIWFGEKTTNILTEMEFLSVLGNRKGVRGYKDP